MKAARGQTLALAAPTDHSGSSGVSVGRAEVKEPQISKNGFRGRPAGEMQISIASTLGYCLGVRPALTESVDAQNASEEEPVKAPEHQIWCLQVRSSQELLWGRHPSLASMRKSLTHWAHSTAAQIFAFGVWRPASQIWVGLSSSL